jgi:hypothetical protein
VVTIDQLEAAGLARRRPSPTDRRVRIVQTTEAGARVVEQARKIMDEVYAEVLGALPDSERDALLDALVRLVGPAGPLHAAPRPRDAGAPDARHPDQPAAAPSAMILARAAPAGRSRNPRCLGSNSHYAALERHRTYAAPAGRSRYRAAPGRACQ